jgi:hypothetical protein
MAFIILEEFSSLHTLIVDCNSMEAKQAKLMEMALATRLRPSGYDDDRGEAIGPRVGHTTFPVARWSGKAL